MNHPVNEASRLRKAHLRRLRSPLLFRLYLLTRLPSAFFMGIALEACTEEEATVSLPFWWFTKNPFRSVYFAAQCAAAELASGVLATTALQGMGRMSMLVSHFEMEFVSKAVSRVRFTCREGARLREAVQEAARSEEKQMAQVIVEGRDKNGDLVSRARITWYFRKKPPHR